MSLFARTVLGALFVCACLIALTPVGDKIEASYGLPWLFKMRGPLPPPPEVLVVAIDTAGSNNLKLPSDPARWPRTFYARLVETLANLGAKLIVFDVAFKQSKPGDDAFAAAIEKAGNVLLFQYIDRHTQHVAGVGLIDVQQRIPMPDTLKRAALGAANFTVPIQTGPITHTHLFRDLGDGIEPALPALAFFHINKDAQQTAQINDPFYFNFYGPAKSIRTVNLDVVMQSPNAIDLQDNIVFVGYSEAVQTAQRDAYKTVFSTEYGIDLSGVEMLATAFANLHHNQQLNAVHPAVTFVILILTLLLTAITLARWPIKIALALQLAYLVSYAFAAYWAFTQYYWAPVIVPLSVYVLVLGWMLFLRHKQNVKEKQASLSALTQYIPQHVADKILAQTNNASAQRDSVYGVCLMTDLQGYTTLSESTAPDALHDLLNQYYALLEKTIRDNHGQVANIVGDSLLAIWTHDALRKEDCRSASCAAQAILAQSSDNPALNALLSATSIGVHGGAFSIGNLGAGEHFEYAPVGDTINTTARIEKLNRKLNTKLLISETVARHLNLPTLQDVGTHSLNNKLQTIKLFST